MASLFNRIFEEPGDISVHSFYAALVDLAAGETTKAQIVSHWSLDSESEGHLDSLITTYTNSTNKERWLHELHAVMLLAHDHVKYDSASAFATRMGL